MITFSKFKSSTIEQGKRILKVLQFGAKTAKESYPFGFDSSPLENLTAIYAETTNKGEAVIIGYINKNQIAELGGSRMYSLDSTGNLKAYAYARASGILELNGNQYTSVRYENLLQAINSQNALINAELVKIAAGLNAIVPGSYIPGSITINLTSSQSPTVKIK
jgi:hypothetical protein